MVEPIYYMPQEETGAMERHELFRELDKLFENRRGRRTSEIMGLQPERMSNLAKAVCVCILGNRKELDRVLVGDYRHLRPILDAKPMPERVSLDPECATGIYAYFDSYNLEV